MNDPDSYRQQEGLKLTEEEKRRNSFPLRYALISILSYVAFVAILCLIFVPRIRDNFESGRYLERYSLYRTGEKNGLPREVDACLLSENGEVTVARSVLDNGKDRLHLALEALLSPLSEDEIAEGYTTAINEDTKLLGVSQKGKMVVMELSREFLDSSNMQDAALQIEKTLSLVEDNLRVSIIVDDIVIL